MRRQRERPKAPCYCFVCRGKQRCLSTVQLHSDRARHHLVTISQMEGPLVAVPSGDQDNGHGDANEYKTPENITPEMLALLDAYDSFFDIDSDAEHEEFEGMNEDDIDVVRRRQSSPHFAHAIVMMHLEWMSEYKISGT